MAEQQPRDFDRWVILSLRLRHGSLWLKYEDESGTRRLTPKEASGPEHSEWIAVALTPELPVPGQPSDLDAVNELCRRFPRLFVAADLETLLRSGYGDLTETRYHWTPGPVPHSENVPWLLPVFLMPPQGMEARPWEFLLEPIVFNQPDLRDRCVLLRLARRSWKLSAPIELPLTILDASDPPADWLAGVRTRSWYADNPQVREVGIRLEAAPNWLPRIESARSAARPHILLERASGVVNRFADRSWLGRRRADLKLVVAFNDGPLDEALSGMIGSLPREASLLLQHSLPPLLNPEIEATIMELVYTMVHDFALHELLWILRRVRPFHYFLAASDPAANQALRLSRVMRRIVDETLALTLPTAGGDPTGALDQARLEVGMLAFDFSRESMGLTDMARLLAGSVRQAREASSMRAGQTERSIDAQTVEQLNQTQVRRADLVLEAYDAFGVLTPMDAYVRRLPLRPGWRHRLRVHIGQRDERFSAVEGDVPAIDPLLPEAAREQAQEIDVVVFEKSFTLLSRSVQTLRLPPFSGSKPVYFELRTPATPGKADLRVALYHGNNMLQSFVLEAEIAQPGDRPSRDLPQVLVKLTSSGTARFGNLDHLQDRKISVALNEDAAGGTHTLMIKKGKVRESISLTESQIQKYMDEFRVLLQKVSSATGASGQRLFPLDGLSGPERSREFESYLRQFARLGQEIRYMLLERRGADMQALLDLRRGAGESVQFVRHGDLLPFPWQTIYDYGLPSGKAFRSARVCFGSTPVIRQLGLGETGCPHFPGDNVVCVQGFWSVRHRLEQLTEDRVGGATPAAGGASQVENRVTKIEVPKGNPLVCLGVGNDDKPARDLQQRLETALNKSDLRILSASDPLIEKILWDNASRPALLIVLSHLEPADEENNVHACVHAVVPKPPLPASTLSKAVLLEQKQYYKEWTAPPRPLVLLMACESAKVQLKDLTNLVDTLFGVGAAAVAGTESDVFSDLAADFALQVSTGLANKRSLGDVLKDYAAKMLQAQNPMPFAFTVYGSADLTIERI